MSSPASLSLSQQGKVADNQPPESAPLLPEDADVLKRLEIEFANEMPIDRQMMIRFVRGYKKEKTRWETTVTKLREALEWRRKTQADSVLNAPLEREEKYFELWPHDFHGVSKRGHPIYVEATCAADPNVLLESFTVEEQQHFHIQTMEMLALIKRQCERDTGLRTYKHVVIMDLGGLSRRHMSSKFTGPVQSQINIDQFYYPESLQTLCIINAPFVFRMLWGMVKPWLHPLTAARIKILGADYITQLKEIIAEDQIPRYLGGNCKCCPAGKTLQELHGDKFKAFVDKRDRLLKAEAAAEDGTKSASMSTS
ncbi:CRAL-TRIO domain-containing protein [Plasmodiophora brassicae]